MMHPDVVLKVSVSMDVKMGVVNVVVRKKFITKHEFYIHDHMLKWICTETIKLGFDIVIGKFDSGFDRRLPFLMMTSERSGKYQKLIRKLKWDDTRTRKCECPFKS